MFIIFIDKSTNLGIVISALQIIQLCFVIIVATTVSERIDSSNAYAAAVGYNGTFTPCIIGISCNSLARIIGNCIYVTLQVLVEIVCNSVVFQSANCAVKVVERNKCISVPRFLNDICTVKSVFVNFAVFSYAYLFLDTNTVFVVPIGIRSKGLKLSALFPRCRRSEIICRIAVCIFIISYQPLFVNKKLCTQHRFQRIHIRCREKVYLSAHERKNIAYINHPIKM